ncbi:MAG: hypothetical protein LBG70_00985, partial [Bifidobacteriaceae bacterium]|nr:hypothetical protein [Bifidobacteriaceae bacterium]
MITLRLAQRNLRIFVRDRMGLFFAMLGPLILLFLYAAFLGKLRVDDLANHLPPGGRSVAEAAVVGWVV